MNSKQVASGAFYPIDGYPVAPAGWLWVQVEPPDAKVFLDGFPLQVDPTSGQSARIGLVVGTHWVEIKKEGFQPQRTQVEIQPAQELFLPLPSSPLSSWQGGSFCTPLNPLAKRLTKSQEM